MDNRKWFSEKQWAEALARYQEYKEAYREKYGEYPKGPIPVLAGRIKKH